jgi:hypothetical protein
MRFRKETIKWMDDSTNLSRKEQVVVSRLWTGYTRATHIQECPFCGVSLTKKEKEKKIWNEKKTEIKITKFLQIFSDAHFSITFMSNFLF